MALLSNGLWYAGFLVQVLTIGLILVLLRNPARSPLWTWGWGCMLGMNLLITGRHLLVVAGWLSPQPGALLEPTIQLFSSGLRLAMAICFAKLFAMPRHPSRH